MSSLFSACFMFQSICNWHFWCYNKYVIYVCNNRKSVTRYGMAMISRLLQILGLFCKRTQQKRLYSAKETYNLNELTNRSHPICVIQFNMRWLQIVGMRWPHCIYVFTHTCVYTDTCIYRYMYMHTHIYIHTYLHVYVCTHTYTYVHIYVCTHTYIYIHTYLQINITTNNRHGMASLYTCIYIHTHIYIYT